MGLWQRISSLGVRPEEPSGERRRVALTNQAAVAGLVSTVSFAVGFAVAGPRFGACVVSNVLAAGCCALALWLNARGARSAAKLAVLLPVDADVVMACVLLGANLFGAYFFVFAVAAFLVFGRDEPVGRWSVAAVCTASFVATHVLTARAGAVIPLAPMVAATLGTMSGVAVMATVLFLVHLFTTDTEVAEARLAEEHARSERLLLNILPAAISARLKEDGRAIADAFGRVSVVFADIVGFTELSARLEPEVLVKVLNGIFSAFDDLAEEHGLEKIKTIGDCYMVVAGLPSPREDHARAAARMALAMKGALEQVNRDSGHALRVRIGLHSGPVVAGVIGKRKFIYDLWGDTVNTASRMESSGVPDEIQVTRAVYDELKDEFEMEPRGVVKVKGKGEMETFLLKAERHQGVMGQVGK